MQLAGYYIKQSKNICQKTPLDRAVSVNEDFFFLSLFCYIISEQNFPQDK